MINVCNYYLIQKNITFVFGNFFKMFNYYNSQEWFFRVKKWRKERVHKYYFFYTQT